MKSILLLSALLVCEFSFGQSNKEIRNTYYPDGKVQYQYTYVNDVLNGPYSAFKENGDKWSEGNYKNGQIDGDFIVYAEPNKIAYKDTYKDGQLMEKIVFYQAYPDNSYKLISKSGYKSISNGIEVKHDKKTPNGLIITEYDLVTYQEKNYIWSNGEKIEIELPKPDGTTETKFEGSKPGVYEWKNQKKVFVRPLNESDKKLLEIDPEMQRQLDELLKSESDTLRKK